MKRTLPLLAVGFFLSTLSVETMAAIRPRELARSQTANITVSSVELIEQFGGQEYPAEKIAALKAEIESCGITYNGTRCLDSQFENFGNAGVKDVDTKDKSGYVFFSRFKMKNDTRILLMSVVANKSDCRLKADGKCLIDPVTKKPVALSAFRTANIWAVDPGREKPETYINDFLTCTESEQECRLRPLLAYDPIKLSDEDNALLDLEGTKSVFANNYRRFYQAAITAATFTKAPMIERAARALAQRSEVITKSGNAVYRAAFLNLISTKFSKNPELVKDIALEVLAQAPAGSAERTSVAMTLARGGDSSKEIMDTLTAIYSNAKNSADLRKEALTLAAKNSQTVADKDKIVALLGSADQALRSAAYSAVASMVLSEENLPTISKLLTNAAPNIRGNAVRALSRVEGEKAMFIMASMMKDKVVDIAVAATTHVSATIDKLNTVQDLTFISLLEGTTIAVNVTSERDKKMLNEQLIPSRASLLINAFSKVKSSQISLLPLLQKSLASKVATVRVEATYFIGKLTINEATIALMDLLADAMSAVSSEARKALDSRLLTDRHVDQLFKVAQNKSVTARRHAVALLGKISSKKALQALVQKSQEKMDANSSLVRMDAAKVLGTIYVEEATIRLIEMMNDEAAEVRTAATAELSRGDRLITDKQLALIKTLLRSSYAEVPKAVIDLLVKLNTPASIAAIGSVSASVNANEIQTLAVRALAPIESADATAALITFLADEDAKVRSMTEMILNTRILSDEQISSIGTLLSNASPEVRGTGVRLLNRPGSGVALNLLQARLAVETDAAIKAMIVGAIEKMTATTLP